MIAKVRSIQKSFTQTHQTKFKNLLVSGCSFTYNNHDNVAVSWPYYLRDLVGFETVYDCSQSGAGADHVFNSIVNEIETNTDLTPNNTLVIVMWPSLSRTDTIATQDVTKDWHSMSNYQFDSKFSTFSIFNDPNGNSLQDNLCKQYKRLITFEAQIYESCLKIIALESYLKEKRFSFLFTSWREPTVELDLVSIGSIVKPKLETVLYLGDFANKYNLLEPDGHPTPDGYLRWTREHLIETLAESDLLTEIPIAT